MSTRQTISPWFSAAPMAAASPWNAQQLDRVQMSERNKFASLTLLAIDSRGYRQSNNPIAPCYIQHHHFRCWRQRRFRGGRRCERTLFQARPNQSYAFLVKRSSVPTWFVLATIRLDCIWMMLWQTFTTGFSGHCGTGALGNALAIQTFTAPSLFWWSSVSASLTSGLTLARSRQTR